MSENKDRDALLRAALTARRATKYKVPGGLTTPVVEESVVEVEESVVEVEEKPKKIEDSGHDALLRAAQAAHRNSGYKTPRKLTIPVVEELVVEELLVEELLVKEKPKKIDDNGHDALLRAALTARRNSEYTVPVDVPVKETSSTIEPAEQLTIDDVVNDKPTKEPKQRKRRRQLPPQVVTPVEDLTPSPQQPVVLQPKINARLDQTGIREALQDSFNTVRVGENAVVVFKKKDQLSRASDKEIIEHITKVAEGLSLSLDVSKGAREGRFRAVAI